MNMHPGNPTGEMVGTRVRPQTANDQARCGPDRLPQQLRLSVGPFCLLLSKAFFGCMGNKTDQELSMAGLDGSTRCTQTC
jgi:hypothetical protein